MESEALLQASHASDMSDRVLPSSLKRRGGGHVRPGLTRAKAACTLCRSRKVRCDAQETQPCSNCHFEGLQCVLPQEQRRRKRCGPPKVYDPLQATGTEPAESLAGLPQSILQRRDDNYDLEISPNIQGQKQSTLELPTPDADSNTNEIESANNDKTSNNTNWNMASEQIQQTSFVSPSPTLHWSPHDVAVSSVDRAVINRFIPPYLKPPPYQLGSEAVDYLLKRGALSVPELELRNAILRCYTEYIHPTLPILDLHALQASIENPSQDGKASFTLFQAVMFAGSTWVDIKYLRKLGFLTRKAARKAFYLKARLLYDFDYEHDRMCLIQTLLLLTLWWEGPNEQKDGWYWSCLSLSVSRTIGLDRESTDENIGLSSKRLRRRMWWSCRMRDTIAALGLNRAPRQSEGCSDMSMLTMDDFEIEEHQNAESVFGVPQQRDRKRQLAIICIEMAKLCRVICRILEVAYIENPLSRNGVIYPNQEFDPSEMASPVKRKIDSRELKMCEELLRRWRDEVSVEALHKQPLSPCTETWDRSTLLHRALLSMLYFTALISLYRQRASASKDMPTPSQGSSQLAQSSPREVVRSAAAQVNGILMDLYLADIVQLLPATIISCLILVTISHVHDTRSADDAIRREGQIRLEQCKQVLRELSDAHIAAEWALNFLTFSASQAERKATPHRKLSGMMSGEIEWGMNSQAQQLFSDSSSMVSPEFQHMQMHPSVNTMDLARSNDQWSGETQINLTGEPLEIGTAETQDMIDSSTYSSNALSNILNFPHAWLDFAGPSDSVADMEWIG